MRWRPRSSRCPTSPRLSRLPSGLIRKSHGSRTLTGKEEDRSTGLWYHAFRYQLIPDTVAWSQLRVHWGGKDTTVHWADSDQTARVAFNPNDRLGQPLYVPVQAPYLPFAGPDRLWLKRLT